MLLSSYFDDFKIYPCINCSAPATVVWTKQPNYKFCSDKCSDEFTPVFKYLPQ